MSLIKTPLVVCLFRTFVKKMLSVSVADSLVTGVGLLIRVYRFRLYIVSTKCFVPEWLSCFRISILKSPHKNIVLLFCTFPKIHSISSQNDVSVVDASLGRCNLQVRLFGLLSLYLL